jgi:hypothetical protein
MDAPDVMDTLSRVNVKREEDYALVALLNSAPIGAKEEPRRGECRGSYALHRTHYLPGLNTTELA